jgi:ribonucleoside-diphosphate reductase beta chain
MTKTLSSRDIFTKRINYKPFEYPDVLRYTDLINRTYWVHGELDFTADKQDFSVSLSPEERSAVQNALLAISQIEVAVKMFWGRLYDYLPKPELCGLGSTFAECEFRHSQAYSRLLDVLSATEAFETIMDVPPIRDRVNFLSSYLATRVPPDDRRSYALALIIFALFIENTSLFSQFAIILSLTRFKALLKNVANVIAWTSKDEQIHAAAGIWLFNTIVAENPDLFNEEMKGTIVRAARKAMAVEESVLGWIFERGEIETCPVADLLVFMQNRIDKSLANIGLASVFNPPAEAVRRMLWFDEETGATSHDDFFAKRPVDYSKFTQVISSDNLF